MKTIRNEKQDNGHGFTMYRMTRVIEGRQFGLSIAVPNIEMQVGRNVVAKRLRDARRKLARVIHIGTAESLPNPLLSIDQEHA